MATKIEELLVEIVGENKKLLADIKESTKATSNAAQSMSSSMEDFAKQSAKSSSFFQDAWSTAVGFVTGQAIIAAFGAVKDAAIGFFKTLVVDGIEAAKENEQALNRFTQAMVRSGMAAQENIDSFKAFADQMQETSTFTAAQTLEAGGLLASLTKLDTEGLKGATQASADLAAALGMDLESAAQLVARSAEGNISAFTRYGITIEKGATDAETFANTLEALNSQFGGAAQAELNTYAGRQQQLSNNWADMSAEIGGIITGNEVILAVMGEINNVIKDFTTSLNDNKEGFQELVADGIIKTIEAMKLIIITVDGIGRGLSTLKEVAEGVLNFIITLAGAAAMIMQRDFSGAMKHIRDESNRTIDRVRDAWSGDTVLMDIALGLDRIQTSAESAFQTMGQGSEDVVPPMKKAIKTVQEWTEEQEKLADAGRELFENLILEHMEFNEMRNEILDEQYAKEQEKLDMALRQQKISEEQHVAAVRALEENLAEDKQKIANATRQKEDELMRQRLANTRVMFGGLAALSAQGGKKSFRITKALALAEALTSGVLAVQRAISAPPGPPWNAPVVAGTVAYTAANVARIANMSPPSFQKGGIVPGTSFTGDHVAARVNSGEMILNKAQQSRLFDMANGRSVNGSQSQTVKVMLEMKGEIMDFIEAKLIERNRLGVSQGAI